MTCDCWGVLIGTNGDAKLVVVLYISLVYTERSELSPMIPDGVVIFICLGIVILVMRPRYPCLAIHSGQYTNKSTSVRYTRVLEHIRRKCVMPDSVMRDKRRSE